MRPFAVMMFLLQLGQVIAQQTIVSGKVTDVTTGSPVPFATVVFTRTTEGAITDFDGNFRATTTLPVDSIEVSYIGFVKRVKSLQRGKSQIINFQLQEEVVTLNEVVILPGENPAFAVMREVIKNKQNNDKRELEAYEYESYTRTEFDIDNMSEKFRNQKVMSRITNVLDSIEQIAGEDGKPLLPVLISEAISQFHYRKNPVAHHERMIRTRVNGVGITDGTLTSQVIGSSFQEYNFYQNWMNIVNKEFASPLADGWKLLYEYELVDSLMIEDRFCYQLEFFPKQEQDLAFTGTMWITKDEHALKRIDVYVPKKANLNFIEKIKIQQDLQQVTEGPWLPAKTRVVIDILQLTPNTAGMIGKFYVSNKGFIINEPKEDDFYLDAISMDPLVRTSDDQYWSEARHDSLSKTEENVFIMIDTLKQLGPVKAFTTGFKFGVTGYIQAGKVDIGPYSTFFGDNDVEGVRIGMGARTNINFSQKWVFGGYLGYGFGDKRYKYRAYTYTILSRKPWTTLQYEQQIEVDQIWLLNENIDPSSLFYTFSRFGTLTQPFLKEKYRLTFSRQLAKGLNADFSFRHESHTPLFDFNYFSDEARTTTASSYKISEATANIRYGKDEVLIVNDNERLSLGTIRAPLFNFQYTYGADQVLGSDFSYHKFRFSVRQKQKMGIFGISQFRFGGGYFSGNAPYSMLFSPIGNETPFFLGFTYNLMNFYEFSSDRYIEFRHNHSFEGFLLNRIPLLKKLKLRSIISSNILWGDLSEKNIAISQFETDNLGNALLPFNRWGTEPYIEVGYGISNILRVLSIQAFHRLTYTNSSVDAFAIKFSLDFRL